MPDLNTKPQNSEQYQGTHIAFASFLKDRCNMTYSHYKTLSPEKRQDVQDFYAKCRPMNNMTKQAIRNSTKKAA